MDFFSKQIHCTFTEARGGWGIINIWKEGIMWLDLPRGVFKV